MTPEEQHIVELQEMVANLAGTIAVLDGRNRALLKLLRRCFLAMKSARFLIVEHRRDVLDAALKAVAEVLDPPKR